MARQTLNQVRSTIIGVGGFGLHTLGHFAPRLRFLNNQRRLADRGLPDLDRLVSYAAIIPRRPGLAGEGITPGLQLWLPKRQNLQDLDPLEVQRFWRAVSRFVQEGYQLPDEPDGPVHALNMAARAWQQANPDRGNRLFLAEVVNDALVRYLAPHFRVVETSPFEESGARLRRADVLDTLMHSANPFGTQLEYQLSQAYQDLVQPIEDQTEVTIYVIGSVCEDWSSALFWPLCQLLRRRLADYQVEIVGLLSTGPYSPPPYRAYEEASAFAGLYELDRLSRRDGALQLDDSVFENWESLREAVGQAGFDRCYLMDAVKVSRATAGSEREAVISIANALELFIAGNGDLIIQEQLAAGVSLKWATTYSALGAAVKFLPIQKIQYWVTKRLGAEIAQDHLLAGAENQDEARLRDAHERGRRFAEERRLTLEGAGRALAAAAPIVPQADGQGEQLPTYRLRDGAWLLPPALRGGGPRRRRPELLAWYYAVNRYREELVSAESSEPLRQVAAGAAEARPDGLVARLLGQWRLQMAIEAGTAQTAPVRDIELQADGQYVGWHGEGDAAAPVWLITAPDPAAGPTGNALVIRYYNRYLGLDGYLGRPIADVHYQTNQLFRATQRVEQPSREEARTFLSQWRADLLAQAERELVGDNKGLPLAQEWLRGVQAVLHQQLERLPQDDRAEQEFGEAWARRHIALEQTLGGRPQETVEQPGGNVRPETRGLAQRRPEPAALIGRAMAAAGSLLFLLFGFAQRVGLALSNWQAAGLAAAVVAGAALPAGALWLVHRIQDDRFRRRTLNLFGEQVNHYLGRAVLDATGETLRRSFDLVSALLIGVTHDVRAAEAWRDESLAAHDWSMEELSDTILRQAIGERELIDEVGQLNRRGRDKLLDDINRESNLWRWSDKQDGTPAAQAVPEALRRYGEFAARLAANQGPDVATGLAAELAAQIWPSLQRSVERVAERFVGQEIPYKQNIETYIERHPRIISQSAGENGHVETEEGIFNPQEYLIDMGYLAKPYIFLEEEMLDQPVVSINLLGVDREERTRFDRQFLSDLRPDARWSTHPPIVVTTRDPFAITYLRTLHGLMPESMSRWERYRDAFCHLAEGDRLLLQVLADYGVPHKPENTSLFTEEPIAGADEEPLDEAQAGEEEGGAEAPAPA